MEFSKVNLKDLETVAQYIRAQQNRIILFKGDLGAGKTTLIKELCRQEGVQDEMSSPTFAIINEYLGKEGPLYHFDLYRIENQEELYDLGFEDYLESSCFCLIEWPEIAVDILQHYDTQMVTIKLNMDQSRSIFVI